MLIKKTILSLGFIAIIGIASTVSASGMGVVDYQYLVVHHPNYQTTTQTYSSFVKKYREEFNSIAVGKSDAEKQQLVNNYNEQLKTQREQLFIPIGNSILDAVKKVKSSKGLDFVVIKGSVLIGKTVDITNDVLAKLK